MPNTHHPLIDADELFHIPVPFESADDGEAWTADEYFVFFLTRPSPLYTKEDGYIPGNSGLPFDIEYRSALSVFYRHSKDPHNKKYHPIAVYTIERFDISTMNGGQLGNDTDSGSNYMAQMPYMLGKYYDTMHHSLGICDADESEINDRNLLMKLFMKDFGITEFPSRVGTIRSTMHTRMLD